MTDQKCITCAAEQPLSAFHRSVSAKNGHYRQCKLCRSEIAKQKRLANPDAYKLQQQKQNEARNAKVRQEREAGTNRAYYIVLDSKKSDRKHKRDNDLNVAVVDTMLDAECSYCGDVELMRVLDRVDNRIGHVSTNVVVACIRCNYIRNSMPIEAWREIIDGVRKAREKGLFSDWRSKPFPRK